MELEKILSISGKPGLYYLLGQSRGGVIVESMIDGKRFPVGMKRNISALSDIAIYTYSEEIRLDEIFRSISEVYGEEKLPVKADDASLLKDFRRILKEFDEERVYPSHIRKLYGWYEALKKSGKLEDLLKATEAEETESEEDQSEEE